MRRIALQSFSEQSLTCSIGLQLCHDEPGRQLHAHCEARRCLLPSRCTVRTSGLLCLFSAVLSLSLGSWILSKLNAAAETVAKTMEKCVRAPSSSAHSARAEHLLSQV